MSIRFQGSFSQLSQFKQRVIVVSDPNFSNVVTLLHMEDAIGSPTLADSSNSKIIYTNGGAISTAKAKFGNSSLSFDGTGTWNTKITNSSLSPPSINLSGSFTIEMWVYINSLNHYSNGFLTSPLSINSPTADNNSLNIADILFGGSAATTITTVGISSLGGAVFVGGSATVSTGVWHHVAWSRNGTTNYMFLDGVMVGSPVTNSTNFSPSASSAAIQLGGLGIQNFSYNLNGFIDEVRITSGICRYTANFTPPTAAFPNQ